jgi:hypothetical protein
MSHARHIYVAASSPACRPVCRAAGGALGRQQRPLAHGRPGLRPAAVAPVRAVLWWAPFPLLLFTCSPGRMRSRPLFTMSVVQPWSGGVGARFRLRRPSCPFCMLPHTLACRGPALRALGLRPWASGKGFRMPPVPAFSPTRLGTPKGARTQGLSFPFCCRRRPAAGQHAWVWRGRIPEPAAPGGRLARAARRGAVGAAARARAPCAGLVPVSACCCAASGCHAVCIGEAAASLRLRVPLAL